MDFSRNNKLKPRVLLVEDNPGDIRLTQEALKESTMEIVLDVVSDGEQALDITEHLIRSGAIDIIVIDPVTGDQMRLSHQVKYYPAERDESLVDAYERLGGPVAPPMEVSVPPALFHGPELRSGT